MANYKKIIDFICDFYGNQEFTPLSVPRFLGNEKKYLNECVDTTYVSSVGKFVDRFEEEMARYTGAKKAVVCESKHTSKDYIADAVMQFAGFYTQNCLWEVKCDYQCIIGDYRLFPSFFGCYVVNNLDHIRSQIRSIIVN